MAQNSGRAGEEYAAKWLEEHGYHILEQNYHSRFGEIDIIAEDSQYIVFVEVKTRAEGSMVSPLEPRFDIAAVTTLHFEPLGLQYYANAFGC